MKSWYIIGLAVLYTIGALLIGMLGYHVLEEMSWVDSFLNASMILAGMGPVVPLQFYWAKIFAGVYALVSGLAFIGFIALILHGPFASFLLLQYGVINPKRPIHRGVV